MYLLSSIGFLVIYILTMGKKIGVVVGSNVMRECDPMGCGYYGAKRGSHVHNGIDLLSNAGESVYAPFDSVITRFGFPSSDLNYRLVEFQGVGTYKGWMCKIMYVNENPFIVGETVTKGQYITTAQNIAQKYGGGMQNHVHLELRIKGVLVDPAKYI